jgi:hypothetical protein
MKSCLIRKCTRTPRGAVAILIIFATPGERAADRLGGGARWDVPIGTLRSIERQSGLKLR